MKALHEAIAVAIDEVCALAAHRFTDEHAPGTGYVQRGGVKLEELKIGEFRARAPRHGNAVAGGNFRVGGFAEHLPCSAGSKHGCARPDDLQPVARMPAQRSKHAPRSVRSTQKINDKAAIEHANAARRAHAFNQTTRKLIARCITIGMHDPRVMMPTLQTKRRRTIRSAIDTHAPL